MYVFVCEACRENHKPSQGQMSIEEGYSSAALHDLSFILLDILLRFLTRVTQRRIERKKEDTGVLLCTKGCAVQTLKGCFD